MTILFSAYLAPVQFYTKLCGSDGVVEDRGEHFVKQTYRNRCHILGTHGIEVLTIPVEHSCGQSMSKTPMSDVRISTHDSSWRRRHWHALRTAYEGTPYFDFFADDLAPIFERSYKFLCDWNGDLQQAICSIIGLSSLPIVSFEYVQATASDQDFRQSLRPKNPPLDPSFRPLPYYQVHTPPELFVPNLSIVDLLFNTGPEARLILQSSARTA